MNDTRHDQVAKVSAQLDMLLGGQASQLSRPAERSQASSNLDRMLKLNKQGNLSKGDGPPRLVKRQPQHYFATPPPRR